MSLVITSAACGKTVKNNNEVSNKPEVPVADNRSVRIEDLIKSELPSTEDYTIENKVLTIKDLKAPYDDIQSLDRAIKEKGWSETTRSDEMVIYEKSINDQLVHLKVAFLFAEDSLEQQILKSIEIRLQIV